MVALTDLTLAAMKAGLAAKDFTARELVQAHVAAVEGARALNAFLVETPEVALAQADAADKALAAGSAGLLADLRRGHPRGLHEAGSSEVEEAGRLLQLLHRLPGGRDEAKGEGMSTNISAHLIEVGVNMGDHGRRREGAEGGVRSMIWLVPAGLLSALGIVLYLQAKGRI